MKKYQISIIIFLFGLILPLVHVEAGTILGTHKYAWSNNVGYINFGNMIVGDSTLSGYAWSTNKGFIRMNPVKGGVMNDGTGNLSGYAWGEQLGWIDFDNVSINSSGRFTGTASGQLVGTINFDCPTYCDVQTDWRQATALTPTPTPAPIAEGGSSSGSRGFSTTTAYLFPLVVPEGAGAGVLVSGEEAQVGAPGNVSGGAPVPPGAGEAPALFDIISEPVGSTSTGQNLILFVILSIVGEILFILLLLYIAKRVRAYMIRRTEAQENMNKIPKPEDNEQDPHDKYID